MTIGQWFGSWLGQWLGSGEDLPEGSMRGSATITVSGSGSIGSGDSPIPVDCSGTATISVDGSGRLADASAPNCDSWGGAWGASWGVSWGLTPVEEYARSGYWRLFYYQLQEKSLQAKAAEIARSVKAAPTAKVRLIKPKPVKPRTQVAPLPQKLALLQPFRRSTRPLPSSIFDFSLQYEFTLPAKRDKVTILPVREPALDGSDDDVLLLLLAA